MTEGRHSRPNVVLMHCHDLGRFLPAYGVSTVSAPALSGLANEAVTFTNAFATAPQCSPSRASLFTGRWAHSTGVLGLTHANFAWDLADGSTHLASHLRREGYHTELIGVHHESRKRSDDEVATFLGFDRVRAGIEAPKIAASAIDFLRAHADNERPFYLQVGFFEPHRLRGPNDPDGVTGFLGDHVQPDRSCGVTVPRYLIDDDCAREELAELQGAVAYLDHFVGRVLGALRDYGLDGETITIFTTDHGLALPRAKCTLYDPGLEVALMIRYPAAGWVGHRYDGLCSNVDVLPTILDLAGLPIPAQTDGIPLRKVADAGAPERDVVFAEMTYHDYYDPRRAVRSPTHKLIANFSTAPEIMDPSQGWRRRCTPRSDATAQAFFHPPFEYYDLRADPDEVDNLARNGLPESAEDLLEVLARWMADSNDPLLAGSIDSPLHRRTTQELRSALHRPTPNRA